MKFTIQRKACIFHDIVSSLLIFLCIIQTIKHWKMCTIYFSKPFFNYFVHLPQFFGACLLIETSNFISFYFFIHHKIFLLFLLICPFNCLVWNIWSFHCNNINMIVFNTQLVFIIYIIKVSSSRSYNIMIRVIFIIKQHFKMHS